MQTELRSDDNDDVINRSTGMFTEKRMKMKNS